MEDESRIIIMKEVISLQEQMKRGLEECRGLAQRGAEQKHFDRCTRRMEQANSKLEELCNVHQWLKQL